MTAFHWKKFNSGKKGDLRNKNLNVWLASVPTTVSGEGVGDYEIKFLLQRCGRELDLVRRVSSNKDRDDESDKCLEVVGRFPVLQYYYRNRRKFLAFFSLSTKVFFR